MKKLLAVFALFCAGCDVGGVGFQSAPAERIVIDGSHFTVRRLDGHVEVLRTNSEWAVRRTGTAQKMVAAIERTTGCAVAQGSLWGDQVMARAKLDCAEGVFPSTVKHRRDLNCSPPRDATRDGVTTIVTGLDCF